MHDRLLGNIFGVHGKGDHVVRLIEVVANVFGVLSHSSFDRLLLRFGLVGSFFLFCAYGGCCDSSLKLLFRFFGDGDFQLLVVGWELGHLNLYSLLPHLKRRIVGLGLLVGRRAMQISADFQNKVGISKSIKVRKSNSAPQL